MDPAVPETKRRPLVIVVDDDSAVRNSHQFWLELEGFDVRAYPGPNELLSERDLRDSGCLIVNYQMPAMNGLELVARLRDRGFKMPAILVTGHSNANLRKRAAAAGVSIVEKPFLSGQLTDCIRRTFDKHYGQSPDSYIGA
ncbi:MAG TPA: response regulator [Xanthobacteraceae bacterium]